MNNRQKIKEEEDYIRAPKFGNSLTTFLLKSENADSLENASIARLLMISEEEVEKLYNESIEMLRKDMTDGN